MYANKYYRLSKARATGQFLFEHQIQKDIHYSSINTSNITLNVISNVNYCKYKQRGDSQAYFVCDCESALNIKVKTSEEVSLLSLPNLIILTQLQLAHSNTMEFLKYIFGQDHKDSHVNKFR